MDLRTFFRLIRHMLTGKPRNSTEQKKNPVLPGKEFCVMVVDMQPSFLDSFSCKKRKKLIERQSKVLRQCAELDIPVIVLEYKHMGDTVPELWQLYSRCRRRFRVIKSQDDGFDGTDLDYLLRRIGVGSILIMGINASACVRETAESAAGLGYRFVTSDGLISDRSDSCKNETVKWYKSNGVWLPNEKSIKRCLQMATSG